MHNWCLRVRQLTLIAVLLGFSCCEKNPTDSGRGFLVSLQSVNGSPLSDVIVSSSAWWYLPGEVSIPRRVAAVTDSQGCVYMPSEAWGNPAWFLCENHKILKVDHLEDHCYTLYHTTEQLFPIGLAEGRAVYLDDGLLATIVYRGFYKAYSYTDTSVTEITSLPFPSGQQRFTVVGVELPRFSGQ